VTKASHVMEPLAGILWGEGAGAHLRFCYSLHFAGGAHFFTETKGHGGRRKERVSLCKLLCNYCDNYTVARGSKRKYWEWPAGKC
jgi:hypothetical protein